MVLPVAMIICFALANQHHQLFKLGWLFALLWAPEAIALLPNVMNIREPRFARACLRVTVGWQRIYGIVPGNPLVADFPRYLLLLAIVSKQCGDAAGSEKLLREALDKIRKKKRFDSAYMPILFYLNKQLRETEQNAQLETLLRTALQETSPAAAPNCTISSGERQTLAVWLMDALGKQKNYAESEALAREVLANAPRRSELERLERRTIRAQLLILLYKQKKITEAQELLTKELELMEKATDFDSAERVALFNSCTVYWKSHKKYKSAIPYIDQIISAARNATENESFETGHMLSYLCAILGELGPRYLKQAQEVGNTSLELLRKSTLTSDSLIETLIKSMEHLAHVYDKYDQHEQAIDLLKTTLDLETKLAEKRAANEKDQAALVAYRLRLGQVCLRADRLPEAEEYLGAIFATASTKGEAYTLLTCRAVVDLAELYIKQGLSNKAAEMLAEYSEAIEGLTPLAHRIKAKRLRMLARLHRENGRYEEAEDCLKECLKLLPTGYFDDIRSRQLAVNDYAELLRELGRASDALALEETIKQEIRDLENVEETQSAEVVESGDTGEGEPCKLQPTV
jgi:tetratricopeptide (TPR) repeat protein